MGLFKSKGKPMTAGSKSDSNLAVAYDVQSRNKPKMAKGGSVEPLIEAEPAPKPCMHCMGSGHAAENDNQPGMPDDTIPIYGHEEDPAMEFHSMVDAIMHKRKMAEGGEVVDEDENNLEGPGADNSENLDAAKKESYDDDQLDVTEDNEEGDEELSKDKHDRIDAIRKKMSKK